MAFEEESEEEGEEGRVRFLLGGSGLEDVVVARTAGREFISLSISCWRRDTIGVIYFAVSCGVYTGLCARRGGVEGTFY